MPPAETWCAIFPLCLSDELREKMMGSEEETDRLPAMFLRLKGDASGYSFVTEMLDEARTAVGIIRGLLRLEASNSSQSLIIIRYTESITLSCRIWRIIKDAPIKIESLTNIVPDLRIVYSNP